jgi:hypothetical protein
MSESIKRLLEMSTQTQPLDLKETVGLFAKSFQEFKDQIVACHSTNREDIAENRKATTELANEIRELVAEIRKDRESRK